MRISVLQIVATAIALLNLVGTASSFVAPASTRHASVSTQDNSKASPLTPLQYSTSIVPLTESFRGGYMDRYRRRGDRRRGERRYGDYRNVNSSRIPVLRRGNSASPVSVYTQDSSELLQPVEVSPPTAFSRHALLTQLSRCHGLSVSRRRRCPFVLKLFL